MIEQPFQSSPFPEELDSLVKGCVIEPGWRMRLTGPEFLRDQDHGRGESRGVTLIITALVPDTYHPDQEVGIQHFFPVPAATYNRQSWQRWVFDCYSKVRLHECMEHFQIEGYRPYAPLHGPGNDVYSVREETTDLDRRTQFTGGVDHR